jgi:PAS domain S-box-containing protein
MKNILLNLGATKRPFLYSFILSMIYIFFSVIFIFLGDYLLLTNSHTDNKYVLTLLQSLKAFIYLLLTGTILFLYSLRYFKRIIKIRRDFDDQYSKYHKIINTIQDGIMIIDDLKKIYFINEQGAAMFGYRSGELINRKILTLLSQNENPDIFEDALSGNQKLIRTRLIRKGGIPVLTGISLSRIHDDHINDGILAVIRDLSEVEEFENQLNANQQKFQKIVDLSPLGITVSGQDKLHSINNAAIRILGGKHENDFIGKSIFNFIGETEHSKIKMRQELLKNPDVTLPFIRLEGIRLDGKSIVIETSSASFRIGQEIYIESILRDVTDDINKENQLMENEKRLRFALESANQGMYDLDLRTGNAVVSDIYARMIGYESPEELNETNKKLLNRLHPEDRQVVENSFRDYLSGNTEIYRVEFRQKSSTGAWIWTLSQGKIVEYDQEDKPVRMLGTHTDITSMKEIEDTLRKSEKKFREAIMNSPFPVMIHAEGGEVIQVNHVWCELSGYSAEEIPDVQSWLNKAYPQFSDQIKKIINKTYDMNGRMEEGNFTITCKNGSHRIWNFSSAPLKNVEDDRKLVISTAIDLTEKTKSELELKKYREKLEKLVNQRTKELEEKNAELERINQLFVGREFRIKELKDEITKLKLQIRNPVS